MEGNGENIFMMSETEGPLNDIKCKKQIWLDQKKYLDNKSHHKQYYKVSYYLEENMQYITGLIPITWK